MRHVRQGEGPSRLPIALFCQPELTADVAAGWAAGADYLIPKGLATDPGPWHARLAEVLAHAAGQWPRRSLGWPEEETEALSPFWAEAVNDALGRPAPRSLGTEVLAQVLARALRQSFGDESPEAFLLPELARIDVPALPRSASAGLVRGCLDSVVDQLWCLLGTEATQAFERALRTALEKG